MDPTTRAAVEANAAWCDAVCRSHGLPSGTRPDPTAPALWCCPTRTPPLYPDAVTLDPATRASDVVALIDASTGVSVKDSSSRLDLRPHGFTVLFEAQWVAWPPPADAGRPLPWQRVRTAEQLSAWARAHGGAPPVVPALLDEPGVVLLQAGGSGVALHARDAVAVSHLFGEDGVDAATWRSVLALCARTWPGRPVVGYEAGPELAVALEAGARPCGPLRVWLYPEP